jgi:hypothetical protein
MYFIGKCFLALFDLPIESKVVIIGAKIKNWKKFFENACYYDHLDEYCNHKIDLLVIQVDLKHIHWPRLLQKIRNLTSLESKIIIIINNTLSLRKFLCLNSLMDKNTISFISKYYSFYEYLPLPSYRNVYELIGNKDFFVIPSNWNKLYQIAYKLGFYNFVTDGLILLLMSSGIERSSLMKLIHSRINNSNGETLLSIDKIDIRLRGSLILHLCSDKNKFIAKISSEKIISDRLK